MTAEIRRPRFTTSASAQAKRREEREKKGPYFHNRVRTVSPPSNPQNNVTLSRAMSKPVDYKMTPAFRHDPNAPDLSRD